MKNKHLLFEERIIIEESLLKNHWIKASLYTNELFENCIFMICDKYIMFFKKTFILQEWFTFLTIMLL